MFQTFGAISTFMYVMYYGEGNVDHVGWMRQIEDDYNHDGCEWANVSSGTDSPGLSRTKSTEP